MHGLILFSIIFTIVLLFIILFYSIPSIITITVAKQHFTANQLYNL